MNRAEKGELACDVLKAIGLTGLLVAGLVAPGIAHVFPKSLKRRYSMPSMRSAVRRLDKKGWILVRETAKGLKVTLSERGRLALFEYELGLKRLPRKTTWDRKWRVLIFDIAETRRTVRQKIRRSLIHFGFHRLQDSVWVYPFECREVLQLLRVKHQAQSEALYLLVEKLDNDRWLRRHFDLPQETTR